MCFPNLHTFFPIILEILFFFNSQRCFSFHLLLKCQFFFVILPRIKAEGDSARLGNEQINLKYLYTLCFKPY